LLRKVRPPHKTGEVGKKVSGNEIRNYRKIEKQKEKIILDRGDGPPGAVPVRTGLHGEKEVTHESPRGTPFRTPNSDFKGVAVSSLHPVCIVP